MVHVTCLEHALPYVNEELRKHFNNINEFSASAKAVFLRAPSYMHSIKEDLPDVPILPEPNVTCWGTWLEAIEYYNCYFCNVRAAINSFSGNKSASVRKAQAVLPENSLLRPCIDLCILVRLFQVPSFLTNTIQKLESCSETLIRTIMLILDVQL